MRKDSVSREVLRHEEFQDCVELKRIRDWFICAQIHFFLVCAALTCSLHRAVNVESEGPYAPERLLPEAIKVMRDKISSIKQAALALLADKDDIGGIPPPKPTDEDVEMADA